MSGVTKHEAGTFCWVDLSTTDAASAKRFYGELFGWSHEDLPAGEHGVYTMLRRGGRDVAALSELSPEQRELSAPPHWLCYVAVDDADASAARVKALGGQVVAGPFDVPGAGRMALVADPGGAQFALWQAREHAGAGLAGEPGSMCWHELAARDEPRSRAFYGELFGWSPRATGAGASAYTEWQRRGRAVGGMIAMTAEWGDVAPHWMAYSAVDDADALAARAAALGGKIRVPPTDISEVGRFAVIDDPQGATFSILRLKNRSR
jgi:predicted enzyme related to lactoylglutathione lyase